MTENINPSLLAENLKSFQTGLDATAPASFKNPIGFSNQLRVPDYRQRKFVLPPPLHLVILNHDQLTPRPDSKEPLRSLAESFQPELPLGSTAVMPELIPPIILEPSAQDTVPEIQPVLEPV